MRKDNSGEFLKLKGCLSDPRQGPYVLETDNLLSDIERDGTRFRNCYARIYNHLDISLREASATRCWDTRPRYKSAVRSYQKAVAFCRNSHGSPYSYFGRLGLA